MEKAYEEEKLKEMDSKVKNNKDEKKNWTKVYSSNNPINGNYQAQMLEEHNII